MSILNRLDGARLYAIDGELVIFFDGMCGFNLISFVDSMSQENSRVSEYDKRRIRPLCIPKRK